MTTSSAPSPAYRRALRWFGVLIMAVALLCGIGDRRAVSRSIRAVTERRREAAHRGPAGGGQSSCARPRGCGTARAPLFYSFAWRSAKKSLLSSSSEYTPVASDIGQVLTVRVSVQDGDNNSGFVDVSTPPITASDVVSTAPPKFSKGMTVGDTLTVTHGTFSSGSGALTFTYAWSYDRRADEHTAP